MWFYSCEFIQYKKLDLYCPSMQIWKIHGDIYLGLYMRYLLADYESKGATTEVLTADAN